MDVIEGRISITPQQSVLLASYSMQAEFGNYDAERHTPEYLKDFQLFPKVRSDFKILKYFKFNLFFHSFDYLYYSN